MINIEYLDVRYRKTTVLSIDQLKIEKGERVAIIGPSGAGKSTLLRAIKGYVKPRRGKAELLRRTGDDASVGRAWSLEASAGWPALRLLSDTIARQGEALGIEARAANVL